VDSHQRGLLLLGTGILAALITVVPQGSVGAFDVIMPTGLARVLAPASGAVLGGWTAYTAMEDRRRSTAMSDRNRTIAAITGAVAVVVGTSLALLGALS